MQKSNSVSHTRVVSRDGLYQDDKHGNCSPLNTKTAKDDDEEGKSWTSDKEEEDEYVADEDFEILFGEEEQKKLENLKPIEKAWRYAKKPLLSIGAKGATFSHGNSLRQLLEAHTVVKVKVNTQKFGKRMYNNTDQSIPIHFRWSKLTQNFALPNYDKGSLEQAFKDIRDLVAESGGPEGIELIQAREKGKIILFGMPGTLERLERGEFPPPPPPPRDDPTKGDDDEED